MESAHRKLFFLLLALLALSSWGHAQLITDEVQAKQFLEELDQEYLVAANKQMQSRWAYITDVTDEHSDAEVAANNEFLKFQQDKWVETNRYDWSGFNDPLTKREFQYLNIIGPAALPADKADRYNKLKNEMETTYSQAKICSFSEAGCDNPSLNLEPEITEIMANNASNPVSYEELEYVWTEWHKAAGKPIKQNYTDFIGLSDEAAILNGYADMGSLWNEYYLYEGYSEDQFKAAIEELWLTVKPLYQQLYSYVRRVLAENVYRGQVQRFGRLPAHVLGNMWAQSWGNLAQFVLPYPDAPQVDASQAMKEKGYTAKKMFETSEKFFNDLGFDKMTDTFWKESMIEKPDGKEVVCHASAEEFFFGPGTDTSRREDWRIKMCTAVNQEDFVTVHHEMGHIQYFMRYRDQHWIFRNGANPGFHEAIGDTIALAVSTPAHLTGLGLLDAPAPSETTPLFPDLPPRPEGVSEQDLNYLLSQALEKIAFIPFGYLMDKWRWDVFNGKRINDMNDWWWELREELQGLQPPNLRTNDDFDPGAKYHIPANVEYIRYFVSYIVQFQFYEALCIEAGQYDPANPDRAPLYKCDFDGSKAAGAKLIEMMNPGFSKPWPESLKALTGSDKMDATSLLKYFEPLMTWLTQANTRSNECIGWDDYCEQYAKEYMEGEYEETMSSLVKNATVAEWAYETNVTDENQEVSTAAYLEVTKYQKSSWEDYLTQFEHEKFQDESLKRQFQLLQTLGTAAMPEEDQQNLSNAINRMITQYSTSKICPYDDQNCDEPSLALEPDIEEILVTSSNYDELSYVWSEWRKVAAKPMKPDYEMYANLSNVAALANNLADMGELWVEPYELGDRAAFQAKLEGILKQTKRFYDNLHAYTRMKLREKYGSSKISTDIPPIPASLFGNMWAQSWENLYDLLAPFPEAGTVDVTDQMQAKNWNVTYMFQVAEEFYTSIGLLEMPTCYGNDSMIEKPTDREVVCHASAWDFNDKKDFRIKMCTNIDMVDLITVHHEQGHIQYYEQYKDLPITFREGANPGFHEAIGDVMALSVSTPGHMSKIGLIDNFIPERKSDYNFLMRTALEKIVFLPFAFVMDRWRWGVFSGEYPPDKYQEAWMELSEKYQGIVPPVKRKNTDFDPGAKYHIAADVEYSRYFVANVLQFQIHRALCIKAGQYEPGNSAKPLYRCDIYQSKEAGDIMRELLQAGRSEPWPDVLEKAIGERDLSAGAVIEFFKPLNDYLEFQLKQNNEKTGWKSTYKTLLTSDTSSDNTVPIIVGAVLGAMVIVVIIAYFIGRSRNRKKHDKKDDSSEESGHSNPIDVSE